MDYTGALESGLKESSYLTTTRAGADQLIRRLLACGAIDKTLKIRVNGEKVLIPIRELCDSHGSLLIFDEVITGFRFHYGSFQQIAGVSADLTTYGKIIGGGLPVGAIAGPRNLMKNLSPAGRVYQAGTFSANPLTMRAVTAALEALRKESYERIDLLADYLLSSMVDVIRHAGFAVTGNRVGSMFQLFFSASSVRNYTDAMKSDSGTYMRLFRGMLEEGVYLAPGQFETNFVSFSHSRSDADKTIERLVNAIGKIGEDRGKRK